MCVEDDWDRRGGTFRSKGRLRPKCEEHLDLTLRCPLYPQKRTWFSTVGMSALCHKRTSARLFNHLVGELYERISDRQAEILSRLKIDRELEFDR
jgi:hypothetical protein